MKNTRYTFRFLVGMIITLGIVSCSDDREYPEIPALPESGTPLALSLKQTTVLSNNLDYKLYVFSRNKENAENDYVLESIFYPLTEATRLKLSNADLNRKAYRFLFTGTPTDNTKYNIVTPSQAALTVGTAWQDVRLIPQGERLSIDNYYQVKDMDGQELLSIDTLRGNLQRIVGQMVVQFFKIDTGIDSPLDITPSAAASVFDRIYNIQVKYENYTTALSFDANGQPVPAGTSTQAMTQNIDLNLQQFQANLPQTDIVLLANGPAGGGQVQGLCFLPNNGQMHMILTFRYYDTTPTCGKPNNTHDVNCYAKEALELHIPRIASPGLSIQANTYTVNKAGIKTDRIIDIDYSNNIKLETAWY